MERTEEELKDIARGIMTNELFSSLFLKEHEMNLLPSIFMPIAFGAFNEYTKEQLEEEVGMLYAPYSNAMPRAINGFPMFGSFKIVNRKDTDKIIGYCQKMKEAMEHL